VNGKLVAEAPPPAGFLGMPCLTVQMAATIQGFPEDWKIAGRKTHAYRQVGNAFPPPVAKAIGLRIAAAIKAASSEAGEQRKAQAAAA
jgi:DNA (cytosine-5)-methyltransferase 1